MYLKGRSFQILHKVGCINMRERFSHSYKRRSEYNISKYIFHIIFGFVFIVGVFFGSQVTSVVSDKTGEFIMSILGLEVDITSKYVFSNVIVGAFFSQLLLVGILFISGLCALGQPFCFFVLFYQGLGFGMVASYCYEIGTSQQISYLIMVVAPRMLMSVLLLIMSAKESVKMSTAIAAVTFGRQREFSPVQVKIYFARYLVLLLGTLMYSAVYGIIEYIYKLI